VIMAIRAHHRRSAIFAPFGTHPPTLAPSRCLAAFLPRPIK
jgi:hypothetical protein